MNLRLLMISLLLCLVLSSSQFSVLMAEKGKIEADIGSDLKVRLHWELELFFEGETDFEKKVGEFKAAKDNNWTSKDGEDQLKESLRRALEDVLIAQYNSTCPDIGVEDVDIWARGDGDVWEQSIHFQLDIVITGITYTEGNYTKIFTGWRSFKFPPDLKIGIVDKEYPEVEYKYYPHYTFAWHWREFKYPLEDWTQYQQDGRTIFYFKPKHDFEPTEDYDVSCKPERTEMYISVNAEDAEGRGDWIYVKIPPKPLTWQQRIGLGTLVLIDFGRANIHWVAVGVIFALGGLYGWFRWKKKTLWTIETMRLDREGKLKVESYADAVADRQTKGTLPPARRTGGKGDFKIPSGTTPNHVYDSRGLEKPPSPREAIIRWLRRQLRRIHR